MRTALWLVILFAIAVVVALFAGNNQAMVTIFWPPQRVDVSFNLAVLVLVLLFTVLYVALRALSALSGLPAAAKRWRMQHKERTMHAAFLDALAHLLAGRFIRASRSAQVALLQEQSWRALHASVDYLGNGHNPSRAAQMRALAHLVVAQSAQSLQNRALREEHFSHALRVTNEVKDEETREGLLLRAASWALDDSRAGAALDWLGQLSQGAARRTLALRLKLRATQQTGLTLQALETARLLVKHRAFAPEAARSLVRSLSAELIDGAQDPEQLARVWQVLDPNERAMPELIVQASARQMALGGDAAVARSWLLYAWEDMVHPEQPSNTAWRVQFVQALQAGLDSIDTAWLARIETAQQQRPLDPHLQYLAGMAYLQRQLWGKAQQLLSQAATTLQDLDLQRKAWQALAELAQQRGDVQAEMQAYKK